MFKRKGPQGWHIKETNGGLFYLIYYTNDGHM